MLVKICGITNVEDATTAARWGADFIGLILAVSPRRVAPTRACEIVGAARSATHPVLLFRDSPLEAVVTALEQTGAEWVQLHGDEPVAYLAELARRRERLRIIKAWTVRDGGAGGALNAYLADAEQQELPLEGVILDAPKGAPHPGYDVLGRVSRGLNNVTSRVFCAGGLTPENVAEAVAAGRYDGVDVAGGVEAEPRQKDHGRVRRFIETAKALPGSA